METLFVKIFKCFKERNFLFWSIFIGLFLIAGFWASKIYLEQNIYNTIPVDEEINKMREVLKAQEKSNQIIISIKDTVLSKEELIISAETFAENIQLHAGKFIDSIQFQLVDFDETIVLDHVKQYLPLYLNLEDYQLINDGLDSASIHQQLASYQSILWSPMGGMLASIIQNDPLNITALALQKFQTLNMGTSFEQDQGYVFSNEFTTIHFFITPLAAKDDTKSIKNLISFLEKEVVNFQLNTSSKVEIFGAHIVAIGNEAQMKKDTILTLSLTIIGLCLLIYYVFRTFKAAIYLLLPVIYGSVLGLAGVYFLQGSLSIMALGAGAIILGVAVDFSVHFLSHYRYAEDMETHIRQLVKPLTLGAFTTIAAFFALRFAEAPILRDLGTFAAFSLMGASLITLIFLPQIMIRFPFKKQGPKNTLIDKIAAWKPEKYPILFWLVLLLTPILYIYSKQVGFDSDLMKLNFMTDEVREAQENLNESSGWAMNNLYIIHKDKDLNKALQPIEQLEEILTRPAIKDKIVHHLNPALLYPTLESQQKSIHNWKKFWEEKELSTIYHHIKTEGARLGYSADAFKGWEPTVHRQYNVIQEESSSFLKKLMPHALFEDEQEVTIVAQVKVQPEDRLEVYEYLKTEGVQVVDNQSFNESLLSKIHSDFDYVLGAASIIVFVVLLIAYGRIEIALITFIPLAITWIWILGIMALLNIPFNIVNVMIATLIFGLGDDYSIFMMDALQEEYTTGENKIQSSRTGVYLSVLTTILGLGTLIFAEHPAMKSIALISIIGLICVLVISQIVQPVLFNWLIRNRAYKGKIPFTIWSLAKTLFYYFYFFLGCVLLFMIGLLIVGLPLIGRKRGKNVYHNCIHALVKSLKFITADIKVRYHDMHKINWKQPGIIIANHSSFVDILLILAIHPKIVVMTNQWVWKSPFFGWIVRWADYWPANKDFNALESLKSKSEQGFHILIFPEGTRSRNGKINEFHKGAFYLSQILNLPIIQIYIDGANFCIQKGDFLISKTNVDVYYFKTNEDLESNRRLNKKAQIAQKSFEAFAQKAHEQRPNKAYSHLLHMAYTYKGPVLEWYVKIKARKEHYYSLMNQSLPKHGLIYDLGAGYGLATSILAWAAPERRLLAIDHDSEKLKIATHLFTHQNLALSPPIAWIHKELSEVQLQPCQGIVLQDTLHYLPLEKQWEILNQCIAALKPGGIIYFRDGMSDLKGHEKSIANEKWSVQKLNFNKTKHPLSFMSEESLTNWCTTHEVTIEKIAFDEHTSHATYLIHKKELGLNI